MRNRLLITLVTLIGSFLLLCFVLGEVAVYYEMHATGAKSRVELGDDFGLGILGMLVVLPLSTLLALFCGFTAWKITGVKQGDANA